MSKINDELKLLLAKTEDAIRISQLVGAPKFLGFLDESSATQIGEYAQRHCNNGCFYGGYEDAQRVLFGAFPEWCTENRESYFQIISVTFSYRKGSCLSHRDFLGSLMGLGLTRSSVGDILVEDGRAVAFLTKEAAALVLNELCKVGSTGVSLKEGFNLPLPVAYTLTDYSATIASSRLDAVVAALAKTGRTEAVRLIESGLVFVNAYVCEKTTKQIKADDILKIRGKGKFIIISLCDFTKKQRIILKYKKYC